MDRCIILGGGYSINRGIKMGLKEKLEHEFTIGTNIAFRFFNPTLTCFVDIKFWERYKEEIKKQPLVIYKHYNDIVRTKNMFPVISLSDYPGKGSFSRGIYRSVLTGLFSIHVAINLNAIKIFLLAYDWTRKSNSIKNDKGECLVHYFQDDKALQNYDKLKETSYYDNHSPRSLFEPFEKEEDVEIINVCLESNIPNFKKISYEEFFEELKNHPQFINQEEVRDKIKMRLKKEL